MFAPQYHGRRRWLHRYKRDSISNQQRITKIKGGLRFERLFPNSPLGEAYQLRQMN